MGYAETLAMKVAALQPCAGDEYRVAPYADPASVDEFTGRYTPLGEVPAGSSMRAAAAGSRACAS